ncbi:uncharacterized protein PAC_03212 [Phialocephala subalpina]|uniref:Uncharacterized protein n=1 Tax=Phialocephala subalpina TaxID=576137 RepID=A0A1L7WKN0_9HELO|nr:uncharacterized protein PAC_03212 [Phialocephala subalpina]
MSVIHFQPTAGPKVVTNERSLSFCLPAMASKGCFKPSTLIKRHSPVLASLGRYGSYTHTEVSVATSVKTPKLQKHTRELKKQQNRRMGLLRTRTRPSLPNPKERPNPLAYFPVPAAL